MSVSARWHLGAPLRRADGRREIALGGTHLDHGAGNHQLRSAFVLGQLVGAGALDETETADALLQTGLGIGLGERECQATIASGMSAGMSQPRAIEI